MNKGGTIVFFDLETGGLNYFNPDIQLAAVAVDDDFKEVDSFERKIQFGIDSAEPEALKMNHWSKDIWDAEAIAPQRCVSEFAAFLKRHSAMEMVSKRTGMPYRVARLAGHNVATFDMPRLRRMFGSTFMPAHPQPLDTLQLALWSFHGATARPENNKLETLCKHFGVALEGAHEALTDVRMSAALAKCLCANRKEVAA